jgi:hypothetical protein
VKESGRIFAAPTYLFILGIGSLLLLGFVQLVTGSLHPIQTGSSIPASPGAGGLFAAAGLFVVLHAMASGSTAMTGVEAISNGIPAFKAPEWRNARATLMVMGSILAVMFLGISFLAHRLQVVPDLADRKTVLAMIAQGIYGPSWMGHAAFLVLQAATMMILVLAANTAFADFPRLANFHADDSFLPKQFTTRGHRLVFSNGIIALAAVSGALVIGFGADVTHLIPLYAIGVFTSFTLSQAGMAKRHLRLRESGWRLGLVVNGLGAVATAVVLVVISITKFVHGAWAIMLLVPVMVWLLVRMNHQYEAEREELEGDIEPFDPAGVHRPMAVVLVDDLDRKTVHAVQYAKTIRPEEAYALHIERDPSFTADLERRWMALGLRNFPLRVMRGETDPASAVAGFVGALPPDVDVNVIVPGPARLSSWERLRRGRTGAKLAKAMLPYPRVRTTLVRDHVGPGHPITVTDRAGTHLRVLLRTEHRVVVLVDRIDRAGLRAIRYAMSLGATEVRAVHAAVDLHRSDRLAQRWMELQLPIPLDIVECWDRNVARSLEARVAELMDHTSEVTVVMPRRDFPHLRQRVLHDRSSRRIARALGRYEHVDLTVVPYYFTAHGRGRDTDENRPPPDRFDGSRLAPIPSGAPTSGDGG